MSIFQRIAAYFGREYVLLITLNGVRVSRAYLLGDSIFARPFPSLAETASELLPNGKLGIAPCYVKAWRAITPKTRALFKGEASQ